MKIVAATGHRLNSFQPVRKVFDSETKRSKSTVIENTPWVALLDWLEIESPDKILTGMDLGWDMWVADSALQLGIPFNAYIPFPGQESSWVKKDIHHYNYLLSKANKVKICSNENPYEIRRSDFNDETSFSISVKECHRRSFSKRNRMMINDCTELITLLDPNSDPTGTYYAVKYAMKNRKRVTNFWV